MGMESRGMFIENLCSHRWTRNFLLEGQRRSGVTCALGFLERLQRFGVGGIGEQGEMNGAWKNQRIPEGAPGKCRGGWS